MTIGRTRNTSEHFTVIGKSHLQTYINTNVIISSVKATNYLEILQTIYALHIAYCSSLPLNALPPQFGLFFFFFVVLLLIMTDFVYLFLPETKGVPFEEMNIMWSAHGWWKIYIPDDSPPTSGSVQLTTSKAVQIYLSQIQQQFRREEKRRKRQLHCSMSYQIFTFYLTKLNHIKQFLFRNWLSSERMD